MKWAYAFASVTGTAHARLGLPCQDACRCQVVRAADGDDVLIAVVSDGAGSASRAEVGSQLACAQWLDRTTSLLARPGGHRLFSRDWAYNWLEQFQREVQLRADEENLSPRDFACTILGAVIGPDYTVFVQVGDGCIVVSPRDEPNEYCWIFWPQQGEYENTTIFTTDPRALQCFYFEFDSRYVDEVALFTDGLQRLALNIASQTVHGPFFRPMFEALAGEGNGYLEQRSRQLAAFLDSQQVNDRVDDDKTIVLATRRLCIGVKDDTFGDGSQINTPNPV